MTTIQKEYDKVIYQRLTKEHLFTVNDKKIRVYEYTDLDGEYGYDYDYVVDDQDKKILTEEEYDDLMDELPELLKK